MLNYTEKPQNTYIQLSGLHIRRIWGRWAPSISIAFLRYRQIQLTTLAKPAVYSGWKSVDKYDPCASVFVVLFNGFMSLTSYFDEKYRY